MDILRPKSISNRFNHVLGAVAIILNYLKYSMLGYRKPRDFSVHEIKKSIAYDFKVVEGWVEHLRRYSGEGIDPLENKVILELGPGPDLGIGLILLASGAKKYIAIDTYPLANSTPREFYKELLDALGKDNPHCDRNYLRQQIDKCYKGESSNIVYIVDRNFEIAKITDKVDIVFSQAAFEHFSYMEKTFAGLSTVIRSGGILVSEVDLMTHTSWLRDRDPLNIYRYNDFFYNLFKVKHTPNRLRTFEYKKLLERNGWFNIKVEPLTALENKYSEKVRPSLSSKFRTLDSSEMDLLTVMLMATRK